MSRKCEHGQFPDSCKDCIILVLKKESDQQQQEITRLGDKLISEDLHYQELLETAHRLNDRLDALKLQHSRTLCQLVKRSIIGYSQAALKVMRRVRQAVIKVISRESEG